MTISTAYRKLQEEWQKAKNLQHIKKPVAYALYQVWKMADAEDEIKPHEVDLSNKCGSCAHSVMAENVFGNSKCYVRCTNKEHLSKRAYASGSLAPVRQRTCKACKLYVAKTEGGCTK